MKNIFKYAFLNSLIAVLYVIGIALFFFFVLKGFGETEPDTFLAPMFMLLLLVFSVAFMGAVIFGRPILWYLDGKKKESILLFIYTLCFVFIFVLIIFLSLFLV